jgi:regulator of protease activity HflC (stomatin/prohibitin superfamily)
MFAGFLLVLGALSIKILKEYERGIIFRLGKLSSTKGPGLIFIIPVVDVMRTVDTRVISIDVPRQEIITKDNVSAVVDAVVYYKVGDPAKAIVNVYNYMESTFLIAQTTLRSILGQVELDELLSKRDKINHEIQTIINGVTTPWGINVILVEIKDIVLPETMKRAMARQAEVERERRAKIINAEGESQSAVKLREAANVMREQPIAVQLRYLQTLSEIARENSSTIIFPFPLDFITNLVKKINKED